MQDPRTREAFEYAAAYAKNAATGGWQSMKLTDWSSPGGVTVASGFGTSGAINDLIGRVATLTDQRDVVLSAVQRAS